MTAPVHARADTFDPRAQGSNTRCGGLGPTSANPSDVTCPACEAATTLADLLETIEDSLGCTCCGADPDAVRGAVAAIEAMAKAKGWK